MVDRRPAFQLGDTRIAAGERATVDLPLSVLSKHTPMTLPVHVVHGRREGPTIFVSAAVHGDEIIGVEIVRRLMRAPAMRRLAGTVLLIPIVNAFGLISHSRYLPDRRDLNRSFPGSARGSLASQLAHRFLNDVVRHCDYGIDLHSAAVNRVNLPQIRISSGDKKALELAHVFSAPVILKSPLRDGSLRDAASKSGVPMLLYEAGEGLRFDEFAIRVGVKGVLMVMKHLGMTGSNKIAASASKTPVATKSSWLRAPEGGILRAIRTVGDIVRKDEVLGVVSDPFGEEESEIRAVIPGLIIGRTNLPVVNQGDALFHVAELPKAAGPGAALDKIEEEIGGDPMFDEDEII
ncbi:MAG: succinylglutamate desuccinylase/aspartoacylase family protein [Proteobacteria bacterium]|nr:succinylglutamate desuccinylase/aspartoacylase family protein [Pseudomonadota bacterium]